MLALTTLVVASGMAYTLWWPPVVRHHGYYWIVPGDVWGTIRAAHWIAWGSPAYVYSSNAGLVTLPGFNALLAPFVALASHLNLSEVAPGLPGPVKPSAWLLIGPIDLACAALPLFGADALLRLLGTARWRRRILTFGVAAAVWPTLVIWGHGEDVLALGFAIYALTMLLSRRLGAAGWLLGAALAMQLYAVALIPLFAFVAGRRKAPALLARMAVLPGFLFIAVVVPNPHATWHALFSQPNFPKIDHPTPWVLLAPHLGHGTVAAGPGRIIGLVLAVCVGALGLRYRTDPRRIVWLAAGALALRCVFESVMDPYYVMPIVVMALLAVSGGSLMRSAVVVLGGAGLTDLTYFRPEMWLYWAEMTSVIVAMLVAAWPCTRAGAPLDQEVSGPGSTVAAPDTPMPPVPIPA